jgi:hypothetical protein
LNLLVVSPVTPYYGRSPRGWSGSLACPQAFDAVLIDELFCGGNALALLGASLCEPYAGAAAVLVDELDAGRL